MTRTLFSRENDERKKPEATETFQHWTSMCDEKRDNYYDDGKFRQNSAFNWFTHSCLFTTIIGILSRFFVSFASSGNFFIIIFVSNSKRTNVSIRTKQDWCIDFIYLFSCERIFMACLTKTCMPCPWWGISFRWLFTSRTDEVCMCLWECWLHNRYVTGDWSECSQSCGQGFRTRSVECKIFLQFSRTIATLPDQECPGVKPTSTELCVGIKCSPSTFLAKSSVGKHERKNTSSVTDDLDADSVNSIEWPDVNKATPKKPSDRSSLGREAYEWRSDGFTTCSASCLGGEFSKSLTSAVIARNLQMYRQTQEQDNINN